MPDENTKKTRVIIIMLIPNIEEDVSLCPTCEGLPCVEFLPLSASDIM